MKVYEINKNIKKYSFGNPINTNSVVLNGTEIKCNNVPYLNILNSNTLEYKLENEEIVYGLGENVRGLNKRGWIYESFCSDEFSHTPNKKSLYGAHNFLIVYGKKTFGIFIDHPGKVTFDIGYSDFNELYIKFEDFNFNLYIVEGDSLNQIVKNFRELIGESYVPPKFGFGYGQSRWSYKNEEEVLTVFNEFKNKNIPIDSIYLDIDYMERFKNFTIDRNNFKNFESLVSNLRNEGVRLIPIIDAGVKIEKGYSVYEEGIKNKYFCLDEDGNPFVAAVWPGKVHFPDFLNSDARKWFGQKYEGVINAGIEGFWNDMNEPAIFYSEKGLKDAFKKIKTMENENPNVYEFFDIKDTFTKLSNSLDDYKSFYHNIDGVRKNHYDVHNLYGYNMTKAAFEGFKEINKNKRFLLFSRASCIGMHRYGGIWTGDNTSSFENLEQNIKMMPSLNMCGFLYAGADTGGFCDNTTSDLLIRWNQFSIFTPIYRNHSALGTRNQEPYAFDEYTEKTLKNIISLRYSLIPYLYSEFLKCIKENKMYFKPLTFEFKDEAAKRVEDQLVVGESIMIAPIYKQNVDGRYVYLPEDMVLWKAKDFDEFDFKILKKGHHYINLNLDEFPIFIRKDKGLILTKPSKNTKSLDIRKVKFIAYVENEVSYDLWDDDGDSFNYKNSNLKMLHIDIKKCGDDFKICANKFNDCNVNIVEVIIINSKGKEIIKSINL